VTSVLSVYLQDLVSLAQLLPDWLHLRHKQSHGIASDDFETESFRGAGDSHVSGFPADVRRERKERGKGDRRRKREKLVHLLSIRYIHYRTCTLNGAPSRCMLCKPPNTVITSTHVVAIAVSKSKAPSVTIYTTNFPIVYSPAGFHAEKV
jgi:hypothetical protein